MFLIILHLNKNKKNPISRIDSVTIAQINKIDMNYMFSFIVSALFQYYTKNL